MTIKGAEVVKFLEGKATDHKGRFLHDYIDYSDERLEKSHDIIQWMFPLHEGSDHASDYPILSPDVVEDLPQEARENILDCLARIKRFFGLGNDFNDVDKQRRWCRNHNHNLLRVTRIIRSMRLLGFPREAGEFYDEVLAAAIRFGISESSLDYWAKAMKGHVWETMKD